MRAFLAAIAVLAVAACATTRYETQSDYDRAADFSGYDTWAWISDKPMLASDGELGRNPIWQDRIKMLIANELRSKGFTEVRDPEAADFTVAFTLGSRDKIDVNTYPSSYRTAWGWGYPYHGYYGGYRSLPTTEVDVRQYTEGQLAIDVFDVNSRQPVWHGVATGNIRQNRSVEERQEAAREVVASILAPFPPR